MIKYFLIGLVTALPFTISFGPVFFAITETSLKRGFISGAIVSFGILISDILYVTLIGLGFSALFSDGYSKSIFSIFGGIMLLIFGFSFLRKKIETQPSRDFKTSKKPVESFIKGFIINSLNPYVALFWTGIVALVNTELNISGNSFALYFAGFLFILFLSDLTKSWLAEVMRSRLSKKLNVIYRIIGVIFSLFGIKLLYDSFAYFST